ncbi:MAG: hypothetical protein L0271_15320 [Gemmatimonadetes bacterium]|nr:hypothetical protein [Gemmatimonadota bacterium]
MVSITPEDIPRLLSAFAHPRFITDESAIREALRPGGTFNVIDTQEGDKIEFWMLRDEPFDRSRFSRKYEEDVFGVRMAVSSPEDTILAKLGWAKSSGGSERQLRDVLGVFEVQRQNLDQSYLDDWAERLGVADLLHQVRQSASER